MERPTSAICDANRAELPDVTIERLADPTDPRLRDFTSLRDVELRTAREAEEGLFIAEGEKTIRRALAAGYEPRAFLLTEARLGSVDDVVASSDAPVYVVPDDVLDATTGYPVHRGALASFHRRPLPSLDDVLSSARRVAVLEDIQDHTNLGAIFRSAAALGVDAVVLTPRAADPLYRRAIRTSMGAVFSIPWTRVPWFEGPDLLRDAGFTLLALTPAGGSLDLRDVDASALERAALAIGNEGDGLSERWLGAADLRVRIPMREGIDSLNAAAAAAVAFYALAALPGR
jgi:tRNA G18 (ribose-2'-O)-methylase SpoU